MTDPFAGNDVVAWCGAQPRGPLDSVFTSVSIDSRAIGAGGLFIAIAGPRHDGHDHLTSATARGAAGWMVEQGRDVPKHSDDFPVFEVADTTRALGDLARGHRARFEGPVIGITGSNGKTTTKELCAAALSTAGPALKTEGNLNNHYGLPLTLLRRQGNERFLVIELGTNHPGEIERLAEIARPTIAVFTNVGTAHIEYLGSREGIASEKGALIEAIEQDGTAILNGDDAHVISQTPRTRGTVWRFGSAASEELRAEDVRWSDGRFHFSLVSPKGTAAISIVGIGETTLPNGLAAAGAALAAGATLDEVAHGLESYRPIAGRLAPVTLRDDILVVDDSYNANPQSMEASLRMLATSAACATGRHIAVLGDMGELGAETRTAHEATGVLVAKLGIARLFAVGAHASAIAHGATSAGLNAERIETAPDAAQAAPAVEARVRPGDRILVKGSRSMKMEHIVTYLTERFGEAD